jgi:hypothetical protein
VNEPLDSAPRDRSEDGLDASRVRLALPPVYRWLIILNTLLRAAWLALDLTAMARAHAGLPARSVICTSVEPGRVVPDVC